MEATVQTWWTDSSVSAQAIGKENFADQVSFTFFIMFGNEWPVVIKYLEREIQGHGRATIKVARKEKLFINVHCALI